MCFAKVAVLLFLLALSQSPCSGQHSQHPEELNQRLHVAVQDYHLQGLNFVESLTRVAGDFQIPMGIEWVDSPSARAKSDASWKHATVQQVLEAIVKTQPGYRMRLTSGIVRISSPDLVPDPQNPLKLNIDKFDVQGVPVELASKELHTLVTRTISPPTPQPAAVGGIGRSGASNLDDPMVSVQLKNSTVEELLDSLALTSARKIWVVTFTDNLSLTPRGFRRTLTLWNDFPIPDNEQPLWDLLHWGDAIPRVTAAMK
jgi:hypothetical protein